MLKLLAEPEVAIKAGTAHTEFEVRELRLRMALARKKVDGCARAAIRSREVDDIRKDDCWAVVQIIRSSGVFKHDTIFGSRSKRCPVRVANHTAPSGK